MYRGTTPTLKWTVTSKDLDLTKIKQLWLTFKNPKDEKYTLSKSIEDVEINDEDKTISYKLTQEETLTFRAGVIEAQIRILMDNDLAFATPIQEIYVDRILKGGVIQ